MKEFPRVGCTDVCHPAMGTACGSAVQTKAADQHAQSALGGALLLQPHIVNLYVLCGNNCHSAELALKN